MNKMGPEKVMEMAPKSHSYPVVTLSQLPANTYACTTKLDVVTVGPGM